jgi:hypothetical protein
VNNNKNIDILDVLSLLWDDNNYSISLVAVTTPWISIDSQGIPWCGGLMIKTFTVLNFIFFIAKAKYSYFGAEGEPD